MKNSGTVILNGLLAKDDRRVQDTNKQAEYIKDLLQSPDIKKYFKINENKIFRDGELVLQFNLLIKQNILSRISIHFNDPYSSKKKQNITIESSSSSNEVKPHLNIIYNTASDKHAPYTNTMRKFVEALDRTEQFKNAINLRSCDYINGIKGSSQKRCGKTGDRWLEGALEIDYSLRGIEKIETELPVILMTLLQTSYLQPLKPMQNSLRL